jgi:hypothetical protein
MPRVETDQGTLKEERLVQLANATESIVSIIAGMIERTQFRAAAEAHFTNDTNAFWGCDRTKLGAKMKSIEWETHYA